MAQTPNLKLPFLAPAQAQKHVTVNESLAELDALVHCAVLGMQRNDPPSGPAEGDRWLVGPAPTGDWAGEAGAIACWRQSGWTFSRPRPGWRIYDLAASRLWALSAAGAWTETGGGAAPTELQNATRLGLGMEADAANPFAAKLNAALFTARPASEGGDGNLFVACNKAAAARDAGFVFQTGFVTRAIAGLFGSNRFRLAVSADGIAFNDALSVDETTGVVDQPRLPRFKAHANFDVYGAVDAWTKVAINTAEANDQGAFNATTNRFVAPAAGFYVFGASLLFRQNASNAARLRGRLVVNGTTELKGSYGEISSSHVTQATALWLHGATPLAKNDTVELQGYFRGADGYFAKDHTTFWGFKAG